MAIIGVIRGQKVFSASFRVISRISPAKASSRVKPMSTYSDPAVDQIYELLFCDDLERYRGSAVANEYPWNALFASATKSVELERIVSDPDLETRPKILAANLLQSLNKTLDNKRLFGVIVEVGMEEGLDVLAAYEDGAARYINYTGSMIIWENKTEESNDLVADLFLAARNVVEQIGPWEAARLPRPVAGNIRLTFLVADGLYFGEGSFEDLMADPAGRLVLDAGGELLVQLVETVSQKH